MTSQNYKRKYLVNALSHDKDKGNPTTVFVVDSLSSNEELNNIAKEQLTPVIVFVSLQKIGYQIRWFTRLGEISFCGNGTAAAAKVLFELNSLEKITFINDNKNYHVYKYDNNIVLQLEKWDLKQENTEIYKNSLGMECIDAFSSRDLVIVLNSVKAVQAYKPIESVLMNLPWHALIICSRGESTDYVYRFFAPKIGILEDIATGSVHCSLAPYWSKKLSKNVLDSMQLTKDQPYFQTTVNNDSVLLTTSATVIREYY